MTCTCGRVAVGGQLTEHRNWNPDCVTHGTESTWYNSEEQRTKRAEQNERLRDLQARAREARRRAKNPATAPCGSWTPKQTPRQGEEEVPDEPI